MQIKPLKITCKDGIVLAATMYFPNHVKAAIMIAPATGIKRGFYHHFAQFLVENGYGVITYDNRGIGDSGSDTLNEVNASLHNWGNQDMTAVLEELKRRFPGTSYHIIGHSAGGELVGLMDNALEISSMFNYGSSSGSLANTPYPFKFKSYFFLNVYIPICNLLFGKTMSHWVGMGEPLPKQVGKDWRRWCNGTGYVQVDLDTKIKDHFYYDLKMPSFWLHSEDDSIATYKNVVEMVNVSPQMPAEIRTISPKEFGFESIGHMAFFSRKKATLWNLALEWLEKHSQ